MTNGVPFDFDTKLMLLVQQDDAASFDMLLQRHRRTVLQQVLRIVQNQAVAEELAQDVFVRVYRCRYAYRPTAKFSTWLYRIATNVSLNYSRDERHTNYSISLDAPTANGSRFEAPDQRHSAEQRLVREAIVREIRGAIESLPDKQRTAILLHKYQNLGYSEIASLMKMSLPAVKAMMFRAYERLRVQLAHLDTSGLQPRGPAVGVG